MTDEHLQNLIKLAGQDYSGRGVVHFDADRGEEGAIPGHCGTAGCGYKVPQGNIGIILTTDDATKVTCADCRHPALSKPAVDFSHLELK